MLIWGAGSTTYQLLRLSRLAMTRSLMGMMLMSLITAMAVILLSQAVQILIGMVLRTLILSSVT